MEGALAFGAFAADLTMAPPAAPAVQCRNNGSSSSSSSSSRFCVGYPDGVPYSLVRMCLAQEILATSCLEVRAGSVGQMFLPLSGGTRASEMNARMCSPGGSLPGVN